MTITPEIREKEIALTKTIQIDQPRQQNLASQFTRGVTRWTSTRQHSSSSPTKKKIFVGRTTYASIVVNMVTASESVKINGLVKIKPLIAILALRELGEAVAHFRCLVVILAMDLTTDSDGLKQSKAIGEGLRVKEQDSTVEGSIREATRESNHPVEVDLLDLGATLARMVLDIYAQWFQIANGRAMGIKRRTIPTHNLNTVSLTPVGIHLMP
ncbi:hypothetical protein K3495_g4728 [Podosphaera aphanis]|nr:hypothetical protein K3495_g4728 [Podosphaera aphanis]